MRMRYALAPLVLLATATAQAGGFEAALSNESAQATLFTDSRAIGYGGANLEAGLFYDQDDDYAVHLGVFVEGAARSKQPFSFGVGARFYYIDYDPDSLDARSFAIGLGAKYHLPGSMPMALGVVGFYGPDITTAGDADSLSDVTARFEIEVVPGASAFVGYRWFETGMKHSSKDYTLDDNAQLGLRVTF